MCCYWPRLNYVSIPDPITVVGKMEHSVCPIWIKYPVLNWCVQQSLNLKDRMDRKRNSQGETMQRENLRSSQGQCIKK